MAGHFTEIGGAPDTWHRTPLGSYVQRREWALLVEAMQLDQDALIVDAGAGTGRFPRYLARDHQARVIAVEPSASLRSLGEHNTEGLPVEWREGSPEQLPVDDGIADAVVLTAVLEFHEDLAAIIDEARRALKPRGRLVVGAMSKLSPWAAFYYHLGSQGVAPWTDARLWTLERLAELLEVTHDHIRGTVYLSPSAQPPFEEADDAGRRAGNRPAFLVGTWQKPR